MADKKTMSDEDYLDSLLRSITDAENNKNADYSDKDESDFAKALEEEIGLNADEDAFLNDIENDLFAKRDILSDAKQEDDGDEDNSIDEISDYNDYLEKDINEDILNGNLSNDNLEIDEVNNISKKKKTKKGLFGKNKKIIISDNNEANSDNEIYDVENQTNNEINNNEINNNAKELEEQNKKTENNDKKPENEFDDFDLDFGNDFASDYDDSFDMGFDDNIDSNSTKEDTASNENSQTNESVENQVNDLMNIMGISENSDESSNQDSDKTKSKRKKEKKKKGFFSKKKEKNDSVQLNDESDSNLNDNLNNDISNSSVEDNGKYNEKDDINNPSDDMDMFNLDAIADNAQSEDYAFGLDMNFDDNDNNDNNDENHELDENENLIRQMDRGEFDEEEILNEEETKKEKKKKKEKKPKKTKEKKPKKPKVKKQKVKKPKQPDEIIPIPKVLLIFSFSFVVLLVICLIFGGNLKYYNDKMQRATAFYVNKDYEAAYDEISGLSIKEKDEDFYNQVFTVMLVSHQYSAGKNLLAIGDYEQALHSYLKGIAMYDKYQNQARTLNCLDEINGVLEQIDKELTDVFGLTESKAREINLLDDKEEYAYNVKVLAKEIMEKNQEEKDDSNN